MSETLNTNIEPMKGNNAAAESGGGQFTIADLKSQHVALGLIVVALVAFTIMYKSVLVMWWVTWWGADSRYSHGILVPFISGFAVYMDRERLLRIPVKPNFALGLLVLIPVTLSLLLFVGESTSMQGVMFPLFVLGAVILILGTQMTKALLFPILFLSFMCPVPGFLLNSIEVQIQIWSTQIATLILALMQYDISRDGTTIRMPNIVVTVGTACSGFRMLISLFAFSTFFAYMKEGKPLGRVGTVLAALPLSLVANSLRVTLIALVGEIFNETAMHKFHDYSGYIMLVVSFVALEFISRLMGCRKFRSMQ